MFKQIFALVKNFLSPLWQFFNRKQIFATKNVKDILETAERTEFTMNRALGPWQVTLLGIGAIIGAGIFATIGTAAAGDAMRPGAGASLMLSFVITAVVCGFTALCYAEFASMVPISGSAYTYSYSTLGELIAWIIGWDLIIEYAIGNVAVAISWANYFRTLLTDLGINVPLWLATDYRTAAKIPGLFESAPHIFGIPIVFNFLAFFIVMALTVVLVWGIKESSRFNAVMVGVKIVTLLFFITFLLWLVSPSEMVHNWHPFQPNGWKGTFAGAAIVFFAYIGFDAVSTVAEETKKPSYDLPFGIIASLLICTVFYVVVAAVFTGVFPYHELVKTLATQQAEPLTLALKKSGAECGMGKLSRRVRIGRRTYGRASRFPARSAENFFRDGARRSSPQVIRQGSPQVQDAARHDDYYRPRRRFARWVRQHRRNGRPHKHRNAVRLCSGLYRHPRSSVQRSRTDETVRVPFGPFLIPLLGAASCLGLMVYLPPASWWRFIGWLFLGMAVYTSYGYFHSAIGRAAGRTGSATAMSKLASAGCILIAAGLFTIPHNIGPAGLILEAINAGSETFFHSAIGLTLIVLGMIFTLIGWTSKKS